MDPVNLKSIALPEMTAILKIWVGVANPNIGKRRPHRVENGSIRKSIGEFL